MKTSMALAAAVLAVAPGCHRSGVGGACNDSGDCRSGLLCSPGGTCIDPSTDAAPGTDAAGPGTDATGPGTDAVVPGTDGATTGTDAAVSPTDGSAGAVAFCGGGSACPSGETCNVAICGGGEGFCTGPGRATCGGLLGTPCPPAYPSCLFHGMCVDDAGGICVTPEERMMICAMQPSLWECP